METKVVGLPKGDRFVKLRVLWSALRRREKESDISAEESISLPEFTAWEEEELLEDELILEEVTIDGICGVY